MSIYLHAQRILVCLLFFTPTFFRADLDYRQLRGTSAIFEQMGKSYLAPVNGFINWRSYYPRNLHALGNAESDATIGLIRELFNRHGREFYPTRLPGKAACYLSPEAIGQICRILDPYIRAERLPTEEPRPGRKRGERATSERKELINKLVSAMSGAMRYQGATYTMSELREKLATDFPTLNGRPFKPGSFAVEPLAVLMVRAFEESLPLGAARTYPPFAFHNILLAFLWATAQEPNDLFTYAQETMSPAEHALYHQFLIEQRESYRPYDQEELSDLASRDDATYEEYAVAIHAARERARILPQLISHAVTSYEAIRFPDCVETALRNFFNLFLYDSEARKFDADLLRRAFKNPDDRLLRFYTDFSDPRAAESAEAHRAWAALIADRVGVYYMRPSGRMAMYPENRCELLDRPRESLANLFVHLLGRDAFQESIAEPADLDLFRVVADKINSVAPDRGLHIISVEHEEEVRVVRFAVRGREFLLKMKPVHTEILQEGRSMQDDAASHLVQRYTQHGMDALRACAGGAVSAEQRWKNAQEVNHVFNINLPCHDAASISGELAKFFSALSTRPTIVFTGLSVSRHVGSGVLRSWWPYVALAHSPIHFVADARSWIERRLAGLGAGWCDYAFPLVKKVFEPQRQEDALSYSDLESYKRLVEWLRGRDGIAASDRCYLPLLKLFLDAWGRAEPYTYFLNVFNLYEHASGQEKGAIEASIQEQVVVMDYDRCVSLLYAMARCHVDARQPLPEQAVLAAALFLAKEPGLAASFSEDVRVYFCEALLGRMSKEGISRTELARWAELLQCEHLRGVSL